MTERVSTVARRHTVVNERADRGMLLGTLMGRLGTKREGEPSV